MALTRSQKAEAVVRPVQTVGEDDMLEQTLRPRTLEEYVGQAKIKEHLLVYIEAASKRKESLGHTLLHGPPGLGKTTLAHIMAKEMGTHLRITSGPAIEKPGDLASLLTNIEQGDVLFIDEIHRLRPAIEEVLYSAMEDFAIDLVIGKGPTARSMRLDLQPFTLVGATTKAGSMSAPLRDRFVHSFKLSFYSPEEMERIIERSAEIFHVQLADRVAEHLAGCCRATPRIANRLVRAVRDFAQVQNEHIISHDRTLETLLSLGIDERGLDPTDREILQSLVEKFGGGPVGLSTLATTIAEEEETLEDVYEPYLIQQGYLQRTSKGRMATPLTYDALGLQLPDQLQTLFS
ncbi:Holliday junction branch migration DNA helicase RuvB [Candidatus Peregrinibacteria bacterium CG10_big_fil_rev_8_21_14_0_10_49_10]|nr:MAG: Holliday junction branch migration DNA helicase RuvB [Candidatus Peregrinibacteria bacterium CG10_big_fil_rev_8_21_14_0_10_49_10]